MWVTKYRYPVLGDDVGLRYRELLREIARSKEMIIYAGAIKKDYVHILARNTAEFVGIQGGTVSEREEFLQDAHGVFAAKEKVLGVVFVGERYRVASSGNVTDEVWKAYIAKQEPPALAGGAFT